MRKNWTTAETDEAREMIKRDEPDSAFRLRFGRSKDLAKYRVRYVDDPSLKARLTAYNQANRSDFVPGTIAPRPKSVPDSVIADAVKRKLAPRSLTAIICGDPAPGQSALDRRQSA